MWPTTRNEIAAALVAAALLGGAWVCYRNRQAAEQQREQREQRAWVPKDPHEARLEAGI